MIDCKLIVVILAAFCLSAMAGASAQQPADVLRRVAFEQQLGSSLSLELTFRDHEGQPVKLGDFCGQRPVILLLVYYKCPMLCTLELNGLVRSLRTLDLLPGRDFEIVIVSFDPSETPALAAAKRQTYVNQYGRPETTSGWHFLTGEKSAIEQLCQSVGFRYVYDEQTGQYAHASGIVVLTPEGSIARYFYGIDYAPRDLRLGLVEASQGRIGSRIDQLLLLCYGYDPAHGKYSLAIMNLIRAANGVMLLAIAGCIARAIYRERLQRRGVRLQRMIDQPTSAEP